MRDLTRNRIEFLIADEYYLRQMDVRDSLLVRPPFEFRAVILPPSSVLPIRAAVKLAQFAEGGERSSRWGTFPTGSTDRDCGIPS